MPNNTVIVKGRPIHKEENAGAAGILPGHLLTFDGAGDVIVNATAADVDAKKMFAEEDSDVGDDIETAYLDNARVHYLVSAQGDEIRGLLADAEVVIVGTPLESAGGGELQVATTGRIIGFSKEALTASGPTRFNFSVA